MHGREWPGQVINAQTRIVKYLRPYASDESVAKREGRQSGAVPAVRPVKDMCEMISHGFLCQPQFVCDLAIALSLRHQPEDRYLP